MEVQQQNLLDVQEQNLLLERFGANFSKFYQEKIQPLYEVQQKELRFQEQKNSLEEQKKSLENRMNELNIKKKEIDENIESSKQRNELATKKIEEARTLKKNKLTQQFYTIFYGPQSIVPQNQIDNIFTKYITDNISIGKPNQRINNSHAKINSMKGVIQYLNDHTDRKGCNFKPFGSEVYDISTLAQYLIETPRITAVAFNNGINEEGKKMLTNAVQLRKGTLKVMYN